MKQFLGHFSVALVAGLLTLTGCSSNDEPRLEEEYPPREQVKFSEDLLNGGLVYVAEYKEGEGFDIPIKTLTPVSFKICHESDFSIGTTVDEEGRQHVVGHHSGAFTDPYEVLVVRGQSDSDPSLFRHFLVVLTNGDLSNQRSTRSNSSNMARAYGDFLGYGTTCFNMIGNTTKSILQSSLIPVDDQNLVSSQVLDETDMYEVSGETFRSAMTSWSFNAGISFGGMPVIGRPNWEMEGCFDFGISGSLNTSEDFEYYLNVYKVLRGEIAYNMKEFEHMTTSSNVDQTKTFLSYVSNGFIRSVLDSETDDFDTEKFFKTWGTDMITQAQLGGFKVYVYGRETNTYENSIGFDASLDLKSTKPDQSTGTGQKGWYDIYKEKNSQHIGGSVGGSYQNDEYFGATKQKKFSKAYGGDPSFEDYPETWVDGFKSQDSDVKWQPISYRRRSDASRDSVWNLYPIQFMARNVVDAVENMFAKVDTLVLGSQDSLILSNARANILRIEEDRFDYIERHLNHPRPGTRLVLCDVMMKYDKNFEKKGKPEPFVARDPRDATKSRTYYPMMANKFFDKGKEFEGQRGHAINTNVDCFIVGDGSGSHYWYYALAHEDDCTGIVDITFYDHLESGFVYRGDAASKGTGLCNYSKKVCVKYYDAERDKDPLKKITAFGIYDDHKEVNNIIASTGGAELSLFATPSEEKAWADFWSGAKDHHNWPKYAFYHGGGSIPHGIYVKYSTKTLPIKNIKNVTHPEKY